MQICNVQLKVNVTAENNRPIMEINIHTFIYACSHTQLGS